MKNIIFNFLAILFAAFVLSGCGEDKSFRLSGEVLGGANTNLYLKYYSGDAIHSNVTAAREGKFESELALTSPGLVYILDNDGDVLARMYAQAGDKLHVKIDRANPSKSVVTGSEINEGWSRFMSDNSDIVSSSDHTKINSLIEEYISANPSDVVGALMYVSFYDASIDPVHAGEVLEMIDAEARRPEILDHFASQLRRFAVPEAYDPIDSLVYRPAEKDTAIVFRTKDKKASLIVLANENSKRADSIVPPLKRLYKDLPESKAHILELALMAQHSSFSRVVKRDSAKWEQGWIPGGILGDGLDQLSIPKIPYFIVTDTAGAQIYRGSSFDEAEKAITGYVESL